MLDDLSNYFGVTGFMPHGHCFLWTPSLLWSYVVSDSVIAGSYYSIPFALWYFARKRRDLPFRWVFMMFGVFVMACGTTHLLAIWTIWHADYWIDAGAKVVTAAASVITAILLWPLVPRALLIPSQQELKRLNQELQNEVERRRQVEDELREANRHLEERIAQRTAELEFKNTVLSTQQQTSLDAILLVDENARIISYNRQLVDLFGIPEELVSAGADEPVLQTVRNQAENPEKFLARIRYLYEHKGEKSREEVRLKGGRTIDRYSAPVVGADRKYYGRVWYFRDITERKRSEQSLQKVNRALRALSKCNEALIHAPDEAQLMQNICRVIVEVAGYHLAWVGFAEHDANKTVRPMAHAGYEEGYIERASITWTDNEQGRGPAGTAIRTQKPWIVQNVQTDPAYQPWRANAIKIGYGSVAGFPLMSSGKVLGALCIYSPETNGFEEEETRLLSELADDLAFGIVTLRTRASEALSAQRLMHGMEDTILAMGAMVEMRDPYTAGHERRVSELSVAMAREMGLTESEVNGIRLAAEIHDLGKIQVPAEILAKPTKLTDTEYKIIKEHPQAAYEILKEIDFPWPIAQMVHQHHERIDGSGYPLGLKEPEILIGAKILAVADTVEAMCTHRPYRPGFGIDKALEEIRKNRGRLYDARAVDSCVRVFEEKQFKFSE
ncbi:MAG: HD domain-containing phosphohydrolase [Burkholderiales bacterium]